MSVTVCSESKCQAKVVARGFCMRHYDQWRRALTPEEWAVVKKPHLSPEERRARRRASYREYRKRHPDKVREAQKAWRIKNPLYHSRWQQEHRDRLNAQARARRKSDPALRVRRHEGFKRWAAKNPKLLRRKSLKWQREHPEQVRARNARRRARKRGAKISDFTAQQWRELLEEHMHRCFYCGCGGVTFHQEHRIPLSRGGNHTKDNIVPACAPCNFKKGTLTDGEFLRR